MMDTTSPPRTSWVWGGDVALSAVVAMSSCATLVVGENEVSKFPINRSEGE